MNNDQLILANIRQRIKYNSIVHVKRTLPGTGSLTVKKGQVLQPHDSLGQYILSGGFSTVGISKILGVSPRDGLNYLQKKIGENIYQGELLAFKQGMFSKKNITAPTDGVLDYYDQNTGDLRLKLSSRKQPLPSGVFGIVDDVDIKRNEVLIKAMVTEIYGLFGSGKERDGFLTIIGGRDQLVSRASITPQLSKHIIVTGSLIYGDTLKKAVGIGISGVISGGLNARDFKSISGSIDSRKRIGTDVGITLVSTEGFSALPIGEDIFSELLKYDGKFIFISGNSPKIMLPSLDADSIISVKKVYLPLGKVVVRQPEVSQLTINIGSKVRLIWPPFMGTQAVVIGIDKTPTKLESGLLTFLITVDLPSRKIKVPFPNVELIG